MTEEFVLPRPTIELVNEAGVAFDKENSLVEEALAKLWAQFPRNTDAAEVLLKVVVLNSLYHTQIHDIELDFIARHIAGLGIDAALDQGSPVAIDLIINCPGVSKKHFSFASKFGSWHNAAGYPIYDRYVDECLWSYKKQDKFFDYYRDYLGYERFFEIVSAFRRHYGLERFTFKQLDKFLWNCGDRILDKRGKEALIETSANPPA